MNKSRMFLGLILILVLSTSLAAKNFSDEKYKQIEDNLLVGLKSDNLGLNVSCAYFLGEMKSERAVIPLLKMLKSGEAEEQRIIAALSLSKINTELASFSVKQRAKFDDSKRVQRLCELFYTSAKNMELKGDVIVEPLHVVDLDLEIDGIKLADFIK